MSDHAADAVTRWHAHCCFSTSISGRTTAGRGKLEWTGEWEFPCYECEKRAEKWGTQNDLR